MRPKYIRIWVEDPFDNRFLGGFETTYSPHDAADGFYSRMAKALIPMGQLAGKYFNLGIRKPKIRVKLFYQNAQTNH